MTDEPEAMSGQWHETVRRVYREVIANAGTEGTTRKVAFDEATERLLDMIESGRTQLVVEDAIRASLYAADDGDGKRADAVLRAAARGEHHLDVDGDPILDVVVVLGDGNRKAWRHVNRFDLTEMDRLRYRNMRSAADAYDRWRRDFEPWLEVLLRHATLGDAVESGDLPPGDSP